MAKELENIMSKLNNYSTIYELKAVNTAERDKNKKDKKTNKNVKNSKFVQKENIDPKDLDIIDQLITTYDDMKSR